MSGLSRRGVLKGLGLAPVAAGVFALPRAFAPAAAAAQRSGAALSGRVRVMPTAAGAEDISIASYNVLDFGARSDGSSDSTPPGDWWLQNPSSQGTGLRLADCAGTELFNCFSFGVADPLVVSGNTANLHSYGFGTDNSSRCIILDGQVNDARFANSNLVAIGGGDKRYLYTTAAFRGDVAFFGFMAWACLTGSEINGDGSVAFQQILSLSGAVTANSGRLQLEASFIHGTYPQVTAGAAVQGGAVRANVGTPQGFAVTGQGAALLTQSDNVLYSVQY